MQMIGAMSFARATAILISALCASGVVGARARTVHLDYSINVDGRLENIVGRDLFDPIVTPEDRTTCPGPAHGGLTEFYRYLIEIEDPGVGPWRVTIETGSLREKVDESTQDRFRLALTHANARKGMRVLTPTLNRFQDRHCAEIALLSEGADAPKLKILAVITDSQERGALSVRGSDKGAPANFIKAGDIWAECMEGECLGAFELCDPVDFKRKELSNGRANIWPLGDARRIAGMALEDRRTEFAERLHAALTPIVYLRAFNYVWDDDYDAYGICQDCETRCTGFFVTKRIIATNAHCVLDEKDGYKGKRINALYGWIRPVEGGPDERYRAPDLQHLTPIMTGTAKQSDYAFLWVEDENFVDRAEREIKPLKLSQASTRPSENELLTLFGYPHLDDATKDMLLGNFDDYCRIPPRMSALFTERDGTKNIKHLCDSEGGASGSPVFSRDLKEVAAIHFGGFVYNPGADPGQRRFDRCGENAQGNNGEFEKCFNTAMPICALRDHMEQQRDLIKRGEWKPPFIHAPAPGAWPFEAEARENAGEGVTKLYAARALAIMDALDREQFSAAASVDKNCRNEDARK